MLSFNVANSTGIVTLSRACKTNTPDTGFQTFKSLLASSWAISELVGINSSKKPYMILIWMTITFTFGGKNKYSMRLEFNHQASNKSYLVTPTVTALEPTLRAASAETDRRRKQGQRGHRMRQHINRVCQTFRRGQ